ncbi:ImuA family protein [Hufsiella arboris]|nr:Error-prone repair protein ImuA [Hufsiella arboris]
MTSIARKKELVSRLQTDILRWQGFKLPSAQTQAIGLGAVEKAFPNGVFPTGTVHEFVCGTPEQAAASGGFLGGILASLMQNNGACLWISTSRTIFPPALKIFGIEPDKVIFIDLRRERDVLWVTEEALKCEGLAAVIAELREIDFAQSRRLQLAVEKSKVTGFVIRTDPQKLTATTCVARWQITSLPSQLENGMPGVGYPRWNVELTKVRNGNPGNWKMEWSPEGFIPVKEPVAIKVPIVRKLKAV